MNKTQEIGTDTALHVSDTILEMLDDNAYVWLLDTDRLQLDGVFSLSELKMIVSVLGNLQESV